MSKLFPSVDPDGLLEYSVVFNDRSLNHMSAPFQQVMRDISSTLRQVYNAKGSVIVPGGGSFGMEAVARQFANGERCLIVRNGWFSYRWTQILEAGRITDSVTVLQAQASDNTAKAAYTPVPAEQVAERIRAEKPGVVFVPHVETASGIVLPDDYLKTIGDAVKDVNGLFVLDCVASGALWVDTTACGVDVLITAPQKGWSASPCAALITLSERAIARMNETTSTSFAADLRKWSQIMQAYESGNHAYHATMPTDTLVVLRDAMLETVKVGPDLLYKRQEELGRQVRELFYSAGFRSVAAAGFESPSVVVLHTDDINIHNTSLFREQGLQVAAGVPLMCGESEDFRTFRMGLFGLEKLNNLDRTVENLRVAFAAIQG
ncbi:aminotransferase class V-fold PLP-dependent enzyme [Marinobacter salexigens]|jgi:aspartate aminotransferase-like enzyme|uniref:Aminotransferase class V-fold PLP-dependent enzyme n=1 Tax=Marinobacter salexigens TaxID=1925763 RepID=A0ABS6AA17_9GAMM|nr:aminotransferase class V-fold PLP-dependent enzyme [Marinobacter salexigens]MBU2874525.1 aminotransferase class V-fold PLP-dependent enzyme [Marinobacter salexigens]